MANLHTAASFGNSLLIFAESQEKGFDEIYRLAETLVFESVLDGSSLTGAPGQPIDSGDLYKSWRWAYPARHESELASTLPYAWGIENAVGPYGPIQLRSKVGGFHSVKLTVAAWPRLLAYAARARS